MSHSSAEQRRVFLAYRGLFSGNDANIRQVKKVRKIVLGCASTFQSILNDYGTEKIVEILKLLLDLRVFESEIQAKITFPELFQTTPARSVQRAASEHEASRSEAEAFRELVSGDRIIEEDEHPEELLEQLGSKVPSLYPASVPYIVQHLMLTGTQRLLEECFFDFAIKWAPSWLEDKGWHCPEAIELTRWTTTLSELCKKLPTEAVFNIPEPSLSEILLSAARLRNLAVHRRQATAQTIQKLIHNATQLATILGDTTRASSLEFIEANLNCRIKDIELNKNILENRLDEQLRMINEQRAELDQQETDAIAIMYREDAENKLLVGSFLEAASKKVFYGGGDSGSESGKTITTLSERVVEGIKGSRGSSEEEDSYDDLDSLDV